MFKVNKPVIDQQTEQVRQAKPAKAENGTQSTL